MKRKLAFIFLITSFVVGCSTKTEMPSDFPLDKGTKWIYSFETYESSPSEPGQIIKATYQLTETVIDTEINSSYYIAHVINEYELLNADKGWEGWWVEGRSKEKWYVVNNQQIFESGSVENIENKRWSLEYVFPFADDASWCHMQNPSCGALGWRMITNHGSYETPAGSFKDCYDMRDLYNGGSLYQTFCIGIGVVSMNYDHVGTRFGFRQTLIDYSIGTP